MITPSSCHPTIEVYLKEGNDSVVQKERERERYRHRGSKVHERESRELGGEMGKDLHK